MCTVTTECNISKSNVSDSGDSASEDDQLVILTTEDIPKSHTGLAGDSNTVHEPIVTKKQSVAGLDSATLDTMTVPNNPDVIPSVARQQQRSLFPQGMYYFKYVY